MDMYDMFNHFPNLSDWKNNGLAKLRDMAKAKKYAALRAADGRFASANGEGDGELEKLPSPAEIRRMKDSLARFRKECAGLRKECVGLRTENKKLKSRLKKLEQWAKS
jgi:hypothetical protein